MLHEETIRNDDSQHKCGDYYICDRFFTYGTNSS